MAALSVLGGLAILSQLAAAQWTRGEATATRSPATGARVWRNGFRGAVASVLPEKPSYGDWSPVPLRTECRREQMHSRIEKLPPELNGLFNADWAWTSRPLPMRTKAATRRVEFMLSLLMSSLGFRKGDESIRYADVPVAEDDPSRHCHW